MINNTVLVIFFSCIPSRLSACLNFRDFRVSEDLPLSVFVHEQHDGLSTFPAIFRIFLPFNAFFGPPLDLFRKYNTIREVCHWTADRNRASTGQIDCPCTWTCMAARRHREADRGIRIITHSCCMVHAAAGPVGCRINAWSAIVFVDRRPHSPAAALQQALFQQQCF